VPHESIDEVGDRVTVAGQRGDELEVHRASDHRDRSERLAVGRSKVVEDRSHGTLELGGEPSAGS
jgi:hypothetical protein